MRLANFFTPKKLWIIAAVPFLGLYIITFLQYIISDNPLFIVLDLATSLGVILLAGLTLGSSAASIPYRKKKFNQKFSVTFPLALSLGALVTMVFIGYLLFDWWSETTKYGPLVKYDNVQIPANLDCSSVRNGKFEDQSATFERQGDRQIQILKRSNDIIEYTVEWLSDCEYLLTNVKYPSEKAQVKIVAVTSEGFDCYAAFGKYAAFYRCKRVVK